MLHYIRRFSIKTTFLEWANLQLLERNDEETWMWRVVTDGDYVPMVTQEVGTHDEKP